MIGRLKWCILYTESHYSFQLVILGFSIENNLYIQWNCSEKNLLYALCVCLKYTHSRLHEAAFELRGSVMHYVIVCVHLHLIMKLLKMIWSDPPVYWYCYVSPYKDICRYSIIFIKLK